VRVAASGWLEGVGNKLNTSQRMGVVNLVITYNDGGNLIDFILHFYLL
jgi:hypothetical protein